MIMILITVIIGLAFSMVLMKITYENRIESYKNTIEHKDNMMEMIQRFHKLEGDIK